MRGRCVRGSSASACDCGPCTAPAPPSPCRRPPARRAAGGAASRASPPANAAGAGARSGCARTCPSWPRSETGPSRAARLALSSLRMHLVRLAILLAAATPLGAAFGGDTRQDPPKRESLQQFLEHLKSHQLGLSAQLRTGLETLLKTMDSDALARRLDALEQSRARLVALGPEAAPLLLEELDPGSDATDAQKLRALYVVRALQDLASPAATDRLLQPAQTGPIEGSRNTIAGVGGPPRPLRP